MDPATRLLLARTATLLSEGPQEQVQAQLLNSEATAHGILVAPSGRALGVGARGDSESFGKALAALLADLTDPQTVRMWLSLGMFAGWKNLQWEMVLGEPTWLLASVRGLTESQVRAILHGESVPDGVIEQAVQGADGPLGIGVYNDGVRGTTLLIQLEGQDRVLKWPDPAWERHPGLTGPQLVDWQLAQGFEDASGRVGQLIGFLGGPPAERRWRPDVVTESCTYSWWHDA